MFFSGSSHLSLSSEVCAKLKIPLGKIHIKTFPDGEIFVRILEDVQGKDVFVLQSLGIHPNRYLIELLITIDALKRAAARKITAIIPYFSYARQDRRAQMGDPITAKLIANLLASSGCTHLITCDLHAGQIEGFFEIPIIHLRCLDVLAEQIRKKKIKNGIVVAPDIGSMRIAEMLAKKLHLDLAVVKKDRLDPFQVQTTLLEDVSGKNAIIVDDLCSTAGTLVSAAKLCKEMGALKIHAAITHGVFASDAIQKINSSPIDSLLITNTIEQTGHKKSPKIQQVSIAKMIAEACILDKKK